MNGNSVAGTGVGDGVALAVAVAAALAAGAVLALGALGETITAAGRLPSWTTMIAGRSLDAPFVGISAIATWRPGASRAAGLAAAVCFAATAGAGAGAAGAGCAGARVNVCGRPSSVPL